MTYPAFNGSAMGDDLTYIFQYADLVTYGFSSMVICFAFFMIVLLVSLFSQQRFTGQIRFETSLLAASFVTLGFEVIMMQKSLINGWFFAFTLAITILSFLWVALSSSEMP